MLPKAHLTSHSRMSGSGWLITPLWLSVLWRYFLYSSVYSCHLFLISSDSVRSLPFLSFIEPIFAWNVPLVFLIFSKRYLVFPILCFPLFLCIDHWGRLISPCYSLKLCIQMGTSFLFSFAFLLFASLLFRAVCKATTDSHFAFMHFFFLGMIFIPASCIMSQTSVHSSSGTLSIRSSPLNLFLTSTV